MDGLYTGPFRKKTLSLWTLQADGSDLPGATSFKLAECLHKGVFIGVSTGGLMKASL